MRRLCQIPNCERKYEIKLSILLVMSPHRGHNNFQFNMEGGGGPLVFHQKFQYLYL